MVWGSVISGILPPPSWGGGSPVSISKYDIINESIKIINHNRNRYVVVQAFDFTNKYVLCEVEQIDLNNVKVTFSEVFNGYVMIV